MSEWNAVSMDSASEIGICTLHTKLYTPKSLVGIVLERLVYRRVQVERQNPGFAPGVPISHETWKLLAARVHLYTAVPKGRNDQGLRRETHGPERAAKHQHSA